MVTGKETHKKKHFVEGKTCIYEEITASIGYEVAKLMIVVKDGLKI